MVGWAWCTKPKTPELGRFIALKFLPDELAARFRRRWNAFVGKRVRPPLSIIPTSAPSMRSANTVNQCFIAMEFLDGDDAQVP